MLHRLIYASRPFGYDRAMLGGILLAARRNNPREGITGALICRADLYLQLLEGPRSAVCAMYSRIADDDRHANVERLCAVDTEARLFPAWAMLDDPARSWLWSAAEVDAGAVRAAGSEAVTAVFTRLATAYDQPAAPSACPVAAMP